MKRVSAYENCAIKFCFKVLGRRRKTMTFEKKMLKKLSIILEYIFY